MQSRQLGKSGPVVSALGLRCMGMTPIYATPDPDGAIATINLTVDSGITLIDTTDMYGGGKNEELVGRAIAGIRDKVVLASKFGNMRHPDGSRSINGKPEYVAEACDKSLQRLGVDHIVTLLDNELDDIAQALATNKNHGYSLPEKQMSKLGI